MNKESLFTTGKKLKGSENQFLLSVFDLEPSGIIIHAYNQKDSQERMLPISEMEMACAGITRSQAHLAALVDTIEISTQGTETFLQSSNELISKIKKIPTGDEVENLIKEPIGNGLESVHEILISGLVELCKAKPVGNNSVQWLGEWLLSNNPKQPRVEVPDDE